MKLINPIRGNPRERGSQLVELALVLPVLLLLGLIVSEGSALIRAHQVLNNAAREGARLSSLQPNKFPASCDPLLGCSCDAACVEDRLKQAVKDYVRANGLDDTIMTVTLRQDCEIANDGSTTPGSCDTTCGSGSGCMTASEVNVSYPYSFQYLPKLPVAGPSLVTLSVRSEFRNLY